MVFEFLKGFGKYPVAREALKILVRLAINSGGRCLTICQVMPEGPGARLGVILSSLETSSSSTGVVKMFAGLSSVMFTISCGSVWFAFCVMCSVMLAMCVALGWCRGIGWG